MKPKAAIQLLESIVKSSSDIAQDSNQLKLCLSKFSNPEVFDDLLRCLLDYPTFDSKRKLIETFTLVSKHAPVFALNLGQLMFKLFAQVNTELSEGAETPDIEAYLTALGELLLSTANGLGQSENEMTNSLILPFLEQVCITLRPHFSLRQIIYKIFDESLFMPSFIQNVDVDLLTKTFKLYLEAQATIAKGSQ